MSAAKEKIFPGKIAAWLAVVLILLAATAIGTPIGSAFPVHRDRTLQNRTGENSVVVAQTGVQNACRLSHYGWSACIGKSDAPSARRNPIANGLVLGTYAPRVSYTAYPAQYGQNFIPNIRSANSHFGRDPPVRLQPSTVYDGSTRYDGASRFSLAAAVQSAIRSDLETAGTKIVPGRPFNQTIQVGGRNVTYTAFKLPNGVVNIGRITVK